MKKFLVLSSWSRKAIGSMLIMAFAVAGCDDSSSASAGSNDEPGVESSSSVERGVSSSSVIPGNDPESSSEKAKPSSSDTQSDAKQSSSSKKTGKSSSSVDKASSSSGKPESSSSVENSPLSSSVAESSSSSANQKTAWDYLNPNIDYGELVDDRDGKVYKTVKIGDQVWMAENLNYEVSNSFCYEDKISNCAIYGRLYMWTAAIGCRYGTACPLSSGHIQGACPANWHLPRDEEWQELFSSQNIRGQGRAGLILKANTGLWINYKGITNTDSVGFSILPGGYRPLSGTHVGYKMESEARFWAFSESDYESLADDAPCYYFTFDRDGAGSAWHDRGLGYSVRCVKD